MSGCGSALNRVEHLKGRNVSVQFYIPHIFLICLSLLNINKKYCNF